jgi:hypothetical protein
MSRNPDPLQAEKDQLMGQNVGGRLNLLNEAELNACARALHEFRAASPARMAPQPRPEPKKEATPPPKKEEPLPSAPSGPSWSEYNSISDPYDSARYWNANKTALIEQAKIIQQLTREDAKKNH